jgi:hypothetical protein
VNYGIEEGIMIAQGRVENGVVVLAGGVRLPEGQQVTVLAPAADGAKSHDVLDIQPVNLGLALCTTLADDDLLAEMLEGRP